MKIYYINSVSILLLFLFSITLPQSLTAQNSIAVQGQGGFVISTKLGEIYLVNANTGTSKLITTAPTGNAINSIAIDTTRGLIYYCYNDFISTNKSIYGFNYRTNTHFTLINDFTTAPGSPITGLGGVGTAGATFYKGYLYFGVELARNLSPAVPNIGANVPYANRLYKITLDVTGTTITATSLVKDYYTDNGFIFYSAIPMGSPINSFFQYDHNWGDFVIINDTLFDRSVKAYISGSFNFQQSTSTYNINTPSSPLYTIQTLPTTTILNNGFSYVQTASDGNDNLILVGNEGNTNQYYVFANKTTGTYNLADIKPITVNGTPFAKAVTDCGNVIKGEGRIGNKVWLDANENGIKELTEIGIPNVPVELWEDVNYNGTIDEAADKLLGIAVTAIDGSYEFVNLMQGNYMVRCVQTVSVNYPAQAVSSNFPNNPLSISGRLIDAGDESTGGANAVNFINKSFSNISFEDQAWDFGYADVFVILANNNHNLKGIYSNNIVSLNWQIFNSGTTQYSVERSLDGISYKIIYTGTVYNAGTPGLYKYSDMNIPANAKYLYYRLRITDDNQIHQVTDAILVKISNKILDHPVVFPNPAKNSSTLLTPNSLINKAINIILTNASGQVIRQIKIPHASPAETINLKGIKEGIYIWHISSGNKKTDYAGKLEVL